MAKENYLPVAAAVVGLWRFIEDRKQFDLVLSFVSILPALLVEIAISSYTRDSESDVNGNEVGTSRFAAGFSSLVNTLIWYWFPAVVLMVGALLFLTLEKLRGMESRVTLAWVLVAVGLAWLFLMPPFTAALMYCHGWRWFSIR